MSDSNRVDGPARSVGPIIGVNGLLSNLNQKGGYQQLIVLSRIFRTIACIGPLRVAFEDQLLQKVTILRKTGGKKWVEITQ